MSYQFGNNTLQTTAVPNAKYKTMLCRHFQATGQCAIGAKCQFAHGLQEQRSINDPLPASALSALTSTGTYVDQSAKPQLQQPVFKIQCKYYAMNYCKNGANCQYMHEPEPQVAQQQFQTGMQTTYNPYMNAYQQQQMQQQQQTMLINNYQAETTPQIQPQTQPKDDATTVVLLMILQHMEQIFPHKEDIIQKLKIAQDQVKAGNVTYGSECVKTIIHSQDRTEEEIQNYTTIYQNALVYFHHLSQQQPQTQQG